MNAMAIMPGKSEARPLLEVRHLTVRYPLPRTNPFSFKRDYVSAVEDVSFSIRRGETLGVVGESGSGKTTTGRAVMLTTKATSGGKSSSTGSTSPTPSAGSARRSTATCSWCSRIPTPASTRA